MNFLYPRTICTKFDRIWLPGSGEDIFLNFSVFLFFCYYLPLEKRYPLQLICAIGLVKIDLVVLEKKILK
jgi:hypothetical protein